MIELLKLERDDIIKMFGDYIVDIESSTHTVVAQDTPKEFGMYEGSNLIFIFKGTGEMILCAERVSIKDMSAWKSFKILKQVRKRALTLTKDPEIKSAYSHQNEYIEINYFKKSWYDWIQEIL